MVLYFYDYSFVKKETTHAVMNIDEEDESSKIHSNVRYVLIQRVDVTKLKLFKINMCWNTFSYLYRKVCFLVLFKWKDNFEESCEKNWTIGPTTMSELSK